MQLGPKYKIARRLGAPIFEKTQSQKYALSQARKEKSSKSFSRPKSEFGLQLIEKQKARFTYGISEKQFRNYVRDSFKAEKQADKLFAILESRLDNVLYRAGFSKSRAQARQTAGHGHVLVNGRRVTVPSIQLRKGDRVSLRAASASSALFGDAAERMKAQAAPAWLAVDALKREAEVIGEAVYVPGDQMFDLGAVVEFYNR